jgi:hypothetical protein
MSDSQEQAEQSQTIKTNYQTVSGFDRFGLFSGAIGLIADAIALTTFIAGLWSFADENDSPSSGHTLFVAATGLLLFYGWSIVAWAIARQSLNRISDGHLKASHLDSAVGKAVAGTGLLVAPLALVWIVAAWPRDAELAFFNYLFSMLFGFPLIGLGVFFGLRFLMPLFYEDREDSELGSEDRELLWSIVESDMADNWAEWEKRIAIELERHDFVEVNNLRDKAYLLGVPTHCLQLVFAKYASLHPEEVQYGRLGTEDWATITKALVKLDFLEKADHYIF